MHVQKQVKSPEENQPIQTTTINILSRLLQPEAILVRDSGKPKASTISTIALTATADNQVANNRLAVQLHVAFRMANKQPRDTMIRGYERILVLYRDIMEIRSR
eukprot:g73560.t1